jgi:hypothetical protein
MCRGNAQVVGHCQKEAPPRQSKEILISGMPSPQTCHFYVLCFFNILTMCLKLSVDQLSI